MLLALRLQKYNKFVIQQILPKLILHKFELRIGINEKIRILPNFPYEIL